MKMRGSNSINLPSNTLKTKLNSFGSKLRNEPNKLGGANRAPKRKPTLAFLSSQRFQVMPFADGLRIAHSFGEFAQSLFP
jgi:hypothetical protein